MESTLLPYILYSFGIVGLLHTYFLYPIILLLLNRIFVYKKDKKVSHSHPIEISPTVTIVIAVYNEEVVIGDKIQNCLDLDYPSERLKIFIASDGSNDETNDIVRKHSEKNSCIELLELPRAGKCNAINYALSLVKSEIIVFSDANTEYHTNAVQKLVRHFQDPEIGCVCGHLMFRNPQKVISGEGESLYWKYETEIKKLESKCGCVAGANGAIYALRSDLVEALPANTINDDFLISMRVVQKGKKSVYEPEALAYEDVAPSVESEFKRHIRDGAGHYIAILQLWRLMNPFRGIPSFIFWSHRLLRWLAPFILLAFFFGNLFLLNDLLFRILFFLQALFYTLALLGLIGKNNELHIFVYIPFYFCNLNLALLIGFFKVVTGFQKPIWSSTRRQ